MKLDISQAMEILKRTPDVLDASLSNISDTWSHCHEGTNTWSAFDIVGHLIHGEKTDWIQRLEIVLSASEVKRFAPFDRFAQLEENKGKTLQILLEEFRILRTQNLETLRSKNLTPSDFQKTAIHPALGEVTLSQLLCTWVAHDLGHLAQINRVMAKQYLDEVGPWKEYLRILS